MNVIISLDFSDVLVSLLLNMTNFSIDFVCMLVSIAAKDREEVIRILMENGAERGGRNESIIILKLEFDK